MDFSGRLRLPEKSVHQFTKKLSRIFFTYDTIRPAVGWLKDG
jgi:hypothetical protein